MGKNSIGMFFTKFRDSLVKYPWLRFSLHLVLAVVIAVGLIFAARYMLDVVTHNGEEKIVPDLSDMTVAQAQEVASSEGLVIDVTDSVYIKRMRRGTVYRQNPEPGAKVKSGRRIVLTINSVNPREISMPDLVGLSMRQAKAEILSRGLTLGRYIYVQDMATNNVVSQLLDGKEVKPGTLVESESVIDLQLGMNGFNLSTLVPDVSGLKYRSAVDVIRGNSLNIDKLRFDYTVKNYDDSLNARVYDIYPLPSDSIAVRMGSDVTLYLTLDPDKLAETSK